MINRPGIFDSSNIQTHRLCPVLTKWSSCDPQHNNLRWCSLKWSSCSPISWKWSGWKFQTRRFYARSITQRSCCAQSFAFFTFWSITLFSLVWGLQTHCKTPHFLPSPQLFLGRRSVCRQNLQTERLHSYPTAWFFYSEVIKLSNLKTHCIFPVGKTFFTKRSVKIRSALI